MGNQERIMETLAKEMYYFRGGPEASWKYCNDDLKERCRTAARRSLMSMQVEGVAIRVDAEDKILYSDQDIDIKVDLPDGLTRWEPLVENEKRRKSHEMLEL